MTTIRDPGIRRAATPTSARPLGLQEALKILAEVGDKRGVSASAALARLEALPDQAARVALARQGMTAGEKKDVEALLDDPAVKLDHPARALLSSLVGRPAAAAPVEPTFRYVRDGGTHQIQGTAAPNADVFISNAARHAVVGMADVSVKADANGRFAIDIGGYRTEGRLEARVGDDLLGWTVTDGAKSAVKNVVVAPLHNDPTAPAYLNFQALEFKPAADGTVEISKKPEPSPNMAMRIGEPNSFVHFRNTRTLEEVAVQLTELGQLPAGPLRLEAREGDVVRIECSNDGGFSGRSIPRGGELVIASSGAQASTLVSAQDKAALQSRWLALWQKFSPRLPISNLVPISEFGVARTTLSGLRSKFPDFVDSTGRVTPSDGHRYCDQLLTLVDVSERFSRPGYQPTTEDRRLLGL